MDTHDRRSSEPQPAGPSPEQVVYGTTLRFPGTSPASGAQLRDEVWAWSMRSADGSPGWAQGIHLNKSREVVATEAHRGDQHLWQVLLSHPDSAVRGVSWRVEVDVLEDERHVQLAVGVHQSREEGVEEEVEPGPPNIVRVAIDQGAYAGRIPMSPGPVDVQGAEGLEELVESWLQDGDRTIPVVVFTAFTERPGVYALTRDGIANFASGLAGIAKVVCIPDPDDTYAITDRLGRDLRVFNGSTRVYWPQLFRGAHPLFLPARMNRFSAQAMSSAIRRRTAELYVQPPLVRTLISHHNRTTARVAMEARLDAARGLEDKVASLQEEMVQLRAQLDDAGDRLAAQEASLAERDARIVELQEQHSHHQARMAARFAAEDPLVARVRVRREIGGPILERLQDLVDNLQAELGKEVGAPDQGQGVEDHVPDDFAEAILMAAELFAGTMEIRRDAEDSALNMQSDRVTPAKLWEALQAIDAVVTLWQQDQLPSGGMAGALEERGYPMARVSPAAMGKYRHAYEFTYDNRRVALDQHIRLGRRNRIYWYEDQTQRRCIINHIGHHLSDRTSG